MCGTFNRVYSCGCTEKRTKQCTELQGKAKDGLSQESGPDCAAVDEKDRKSRMKCGDCHERWKQEQLGHWKSRWDDDLMPMAKDPVKIKEEREREGIYMFGPKHDPSQKLTPGALALIKVSVEISRIMKEARLPEKFHKWEADTRKGVKPDVYEAFPLYMDHVVDEAKEYMAKWPDLPPDPKPEEREEF